jgi:outer membrane protein TolC
MGGLRPCGKDQFMKRRLPSFAGVLVALLNASVGPGSEPGSVESRFGSADAIVESLREPEVRNLLIEVLERNPEIAILTARMASADSRAQSVRKLPDPKAEFTAFVLPPETRVGPQRFAARFSQQLPGGGKRNLHENAARHEERALAAELQAVRLSLATKARGLLVELAYVDRAQGILADDHATLAHFEELARARYAAGSGLQMDAIQIQAEMTRLEARRAELDERRAAVIAEINFLRARPGAPVELSPEITAPEIDLDWQELRRVALDSHPELEVHAARIERSASLADIAGKQRAPDFSVGLTYAYVDRRTDVDVPDNGRDVLGISGGITIPVWRRARDAGVEAATRTRLADEAARRSAASGIERELEDLRGRIPEIVRRLALLENVLPIQSEQALASAEAAYAAGRVDALALLDAERLLLDVRLAAVRSRADLAIAIIDLEGAVGAPLPRGGAS